MKRRHLIAAAASSLVAAPALVRAQTAWPGRGPIPVTARNTATVVGSRQSRPMDTQVRGRRTSLRSSTMITAPPASTPMPGCPARPGRCPGR